MNLNRRLVRRYRQMTRRRVRPYYEQLAQTVFGHLVTNQYITPIPRLINDCTRCTSE